MRKEKPGTKIIISGSHRAVTVFSDSSLCHSSHWIIGECAYLRCTVGPLPHLSATLSLENIVDIYLSICETAVIEVGV